jgi:hypothetical protein
VLADKKVIAVGTIPELMKSDHPWIQEYFAGPRGRAALASRESGEDKNRLPRRWTATPAARHRDEYGNARQSCLGRGRHAGAAGPCRRCLHLDGASRQGKAGLYDIYFPQSVDGLAKGSAVSYAGVPAGQIKQIELWKRDPSYVRVRIEVDDHIPILEGTTATIQGSFTGVSNIQLAGGVKGRRRSPRSAPMASP